MLFIGLHQKAARKPEGLWHRISHMGGPLQTKHRVEKGREKIWRFKGMASETACKQRSKPAWACSPASPLNYVGILRHHDLYNTGK